MAFFDGCSSKENLLVANDGSNYGREQLACKRGQLCWWLWPLIDVEDYASLWRNRGKERGKRVQQGGDGWPLLLS